MSGNPAQDHPQANDFFSQVLGRGVKHGPCTDSPQVSPVEILLTLFNLFYVVFNRTGKKSYLDAARKLSKYYIDHLPSTGVPPWSELHDTPQQDLLTSKFY